MTRGTLNRYVALFAIGFSSAAVAAPKGPNITAPKGTSIAAPKDTSAIQAKILPNGLQLLRAGETPRAGAAAASGEKEAAAREQKGRAFTRLRQILKAEPTVKEVQRSALKLYRLEPERLRKMGIAARAKGLVPDVEVSFDNSLNNQYTNERNGLLGNLSAIDPVNNPNGYSSLQRQNSDALTWHVRGTFYLDRLVFNSEELDVRSLNSLEETLIREVTTMYYSRQRLIAGLLLSPPDEDEEIFYELLRLDELTATMDAMTGGMFAAKSWKWENDLKQ